MASKVKPWKEDIKINKKKPKHIKMTPYNRCKSANK